MNLRKLNEELIDYNMSLRLLFMVLGLAIITMSMDSLAKDSVGDPVGAALCNVILIFRGNTARGIAVVGIIVLGIQTLRGKLQWEVALVIVAAIIILFKAPDIVSVVSGSSGNANCGTTSVTS
ncbi:TrbC/VirB2 family type IV secretion system protein [Rickettsia endosymbiont of Urophora cardui]|uniref:TrbC/VirB2 family protein n=1 Tax=Rickettsia endosymbiont of Urophora cardui TaxID=3066265 RepID=UPI00313B0997